MGLHVKRTSLKLISSFPIADCSGGDARRFATFEEKPAASQKRVGAWFNL
jgi:hypothetical protein